MVLVLLFIGAVGPIVGAAADLDILGSGANNTTILSSSGTPVKIDIIGSTVTNTQISYPVEEVRESACCDYCGGPLCYDTPWDDFVRPLCYPWSSYIPTRYNRQFHLY